MTRFARFVSPETVFFFALWVAVLVLFRERAFHDPGALWHIRVGDVILASGLPHTDPFTYTFAGEHWIPQQWLAEVGMSVAHRIGGIDAMLTGFATIVAGLFAWIFGRLHRSGMSLPIAAMLTLACLFAGSWHYYVRPHMATFVFLAGTTATLIAFDRGRIGLGRLAVLIPVFVVWTNFHGGVLGGVMELGIATAWWIVAFVIRLDSPVKSWREAALLAAIGIACLLTPLVNPFGPDLLRTWWRIIGSPVLREVINEHMPADFSQATARLVFGFGLVYVVILLGTLPRFPRVTWLLPLVWLMLTKDGIRQGPLFAVVAGVVLADVWPHTVWFRLLKKYGDSFAGDPNPEPADWRAWVLAATAVFVAFALQATHIPVPVIGSGWARFAPDAIPVDLTERIAEEYRVMGRHDRMYNDANLGGYLIYHFPERKIFMDDRCELYGDDWLRLYVDTISTHPERIDEWAETYRFDRALVAVQPNTESPLETYLAASPRWKLIAEGQRAKLFVRVPAPPTGTRP